MACELEIIDPLSEAETVTFVDRMQSSGLKTHHFGYNKAYSMKIDNN